VTRVTDVESRFLDHVPTEISEVLDWYRDGPVESPCCPVLLEFAGKFLGAIYEDGAVAPETLSASAPEYLRCLMLRQQRSPQSPGTTRQGEGIVQTANRTPDL